jgi:hypothetical protein
MRKRYDEGGEIDAMEEANNRSMLTPRKVSIGSAGAAAEEDKLNRRTMERSRDLQDRISAGSDIVGRPQDEGYRPNAGTARERAMAEGAYDSGKITESGDQGFGGPGSSRTVKATPKAMPKTTADSEITRMKNRAKSAEMPSGSPGRGKSAEMPADVSKMSLADRAKRSREMARSGSGSTDTRSVGERLRSAFAGKDRGGNSVDFGGSGLGMKSGGSVSSASRRADGIATKGKTRGKMC